jgi:tetratricopeptide (TPR) repeat protein
LLSEHSRSPYAALATLNLARQDVEEGNLASAHVRLQWVIEQDHLPELTHLARLRNARLYVSEANVDKAKQLITGIYEGTFKPAYSEIRGDIAIAQKDYAMAKTAYQEALESKELGDEHRRLLQLKLDNLGHGLAITAIAPTVMLQVETATPGTAEANHLTVPIESRMAVPSEPLTFPIDWSVEPSTTKDVTEK